MWQKYKVEWLYVDINDDRPATNLFIHGKPVTLSSVQKFSGQQLVSISEAQVQAVAAY